MIPLPPLELRKSVGPIDDAHYDNPNGMLVFNDLVPISNYETFFDFGCGCGRIARQLMQQEFPPREYIGIDLNLESINWCLNNLSSINPHFRFFHLDVYNAGLNPKSANHTLDFPTNDKFKFVNAHSVFTHITEPNLVFYLSECCRKLDSGGIFRSTWFLFDKTAFPMMQEFQNSLYINLNDPTNAIIYDYKYIEQEYQKLGLVIFKIIPPKVMGFQWTLLAAHADSVLSKAVFPEDSAPKGVIRPPTTRL